MQGLRSHRFFQKIDWVALADKRVKAPWVPENGKLYVPPQDLIENKNKDVNFANVKLTDEDRLEQSFASICSDEHEKHIVEVLLLERSGALNHLPSSETKSGCLLQ